MSVIAMDSKEVGLGQDIGVGSGAELAMMRMRWRKNWTDTY